MKRKIENRRIVVVNQATNYLTVGFCNAFHEQFKNVALITGSIHEQGEELHSAIQVTKIKKWEDRPAWKKMYSYLMACGQILWLLITRFRNYEVFFVSLPPMAYLLNLILPHRFSMVIWDVYPDVFKITSMKEEHFIYRLWASLNRKSFKRAYKLFTISEKMADLVAQYIERDKIIVQPIWSIFQENEKVIKSENPFIRNNNLRGKFVVQYSGNIGLTHNVETLIPVAESLKQHEHIVFQIIGRGSRKEYLQKLVAEKKLPNCSFLPFQSDEMFPFSLSAADLGVVILDEKTSKGSVPSKSYNLMSYGIPALYIAAEDSELNVYAEQYEHAACFSKSNIEGIANFILDLSKNPARIKRMGKNAETAAKDFTRSNADKFVYHYLEI